MNSPALFSNQYHPHLDMDDQMFAVDSHKGRLHNEWVQGHASKAQMDHSCSRVKALLLVKEAERLEWIHLQHQRDHANFLVQRGTKKAGGAGGADCFSPSRHTPSISPARANQDALAQSPDASSLTVAATLPSNSSSDDCLDSSRQAVLAAAVAESSASPVISPSRRAAQQSFQTPDASSDEASPSVKKSLATVTDTSKKSTKRGRSSSCPPPPKPVACGCLHVAAWRLMTPRCRVMALLKKHGEQGNLEHIVDALRQTYTSDSEMIEDMDARYGPEPTELDAELLLQSSIERMDNHKARWRAIREDVDFEMSTSPNAFQNVIRTLSVMRIFIEGSQGQSYGIDFTDRQRREAAQQAVLTKLRANRALFIDQCASPSSAKKSTTNSSSSSSSIKTTAASKFNFETSSNSSSSDSEKKFTFNKAR